MNPNLRYHKPFCFEINDKKIILLSDVPVVPHLLKGLRNILITNDLNFVYNNSQKKASWKHITQFYEFDKDQSTERNSLVPKLTDAHVYEEKMKKMKVSHAAHVFSQRVGAIMKRMLLCQIIAHEVSIDREAADTGQLCLFVDNLFDSANGNVIKPTTGKDVRCAVTFLTGRADTGPSNNSRVCSCHFIDGNNAKGPSIFSWNKEKLFKFKSPEKRKRRRTHDVVLDNLDININVPEQTQIDLDDMNEEITSNINTNVSSTRSNLNLDISNVSKVQNDSENYEEITSNINTNVSSTRSNLNLDISNVSKVQNDSENYLLKMEIEKLTNEIKLLKSQPFSFCVIENTDSLITYYTGMPNKSVINLLFGAPQFTPNQVTKTLTIARARVHVERAINRIKGFCILEFIPPKLLPYASKIFQVCGALSNCQYPLIKEVEIFYLQPKED
ncbi:hypothetical protein ACI65C_004752 [Semiaphis heraclei]